MVIPYTQPQTIMIRIPVLSMTMWLFSQYWIYIVLWLPKLRSGCLCHHWLVQKVCWRFKPQKATKHPSTTVKRLHQCRLSRLPIIHGVVAVSWKAFRFPAANLEQDFVVEAWGLNSRSCWGNKTTTLSLYVGLSREFWRDPKLWANSQMGNPDVRM